MREWIVEWNLLNGEYARKRFEAEVEALRHVLERINAGCNSVRLYCVSGEQLNWELDV